MRKVNNNSKKINNQQFSNISQNLEYIRLWDFHADYGGQLQTGAIVLKAECWFFIHLIVVNWVISLSVSMMENKSQFISDWQDKYAPSILSSKDENTKRKERDKWRSLNHESLTTLTADCLKCMLQTTWFKLPIK